MARVIYLPAAAKYLKKIKDKQLKKLFQKTIESIAENPYAGQAKKGDLTGIYGYDLYYNKTNYEIAYRIELIEGEIIVIVLAGTRENFYEQLKRYMNT